MLVYRCSGCGSEDLEFTGTLSWDSGREIFYIEQVHDAVYCRECLDDTMIEKVAK